MAESYQVCDGRCTLESYVTGPSFDEMRTMEFHVAHHFLEERFKLDFSSTYRNHEFYLTHFILCDIFIFNLSLCCFCFGLDHSYIAQLHLCTMHKIIMLCKIHNSIRLNGFTISNLSKVTFQISLRIKPRQIRVKDTMHA